MLHAPKVPMTGREVLHVVFGEGHAQHSVARCDRDALPLLIVCTCGTGITLRAEDATCRGARLRDIREALKSSPRMMAS